MSNQLDDLTALVRKFCEERDWDQFHTPKDLAIGMVTEASELLDLFRFKTEQDMRDMLLDDHKRNEIGNELADVLYFLLRFAQLYKFDLGAELVRKMDQNTAKYPVDRAKRSNRKYSE